MENSENIIYLDADDVIKSPVVKREEKSTFEDAVVDWVSFWRLNLNRFVIDYLGISLRKFQEIILYLLGICDEGVFVGARGIGKSFIIALYAVSMAILFPNSKIIIICAVKKQAKDIITEKIEKELCSMSKMLSMEIEEIRDSGEFKTVVFRNGSTIYATNMSENRRGLRGNILICDEVVQLSKESLEKVALPFLNWVRKPKYTELPQYANEALEIGKKAYLTSAWYKAHYFYEDYYLKILKDTLRQKNKFLINLDVHTSVAEKLIPPEAVDDYKTTIDPISYMMENDAVFYGESEHAFFKADEISACRVLDEPFYPPDNLTYLAEKDKRRKSYRILRQENETRILSADIAISSNKGSDNSVYTLMRLVKEGMVYTKRVVAMKSYNGLNADTQALTLKRLFYDFECDRMIIDFNGIGRTVYEALCKETYDTDRGVMYPAWGAYNLENLPPGIVFNDTEYVMYALKPTADTNHYIALKVKNDLMSKKIWLPANENDIREKLETTEEYCFQTPERQAEMLEPYRQMDYLTTEMVNLEYAISSGRITIRERGRAKKDRYSSFGYAVYLADMVIEENEKNESSSDFVFFT